MCTKKSEFIYKQNILFKEKVFSSLLSWYALIPFVTVVHRSLVYQGMV